MLGRLPWFAFERRSRALRFLVFFDIRPQAYDRLDASPTAAGQNETAMVTTTVSHIYAMPAVFASNLRLADPVEFVLLDNTTEKVGALSPPVECGGRPHRCIASTAAESMEILRTEPERTHHRPSRTKMLIRAGLQHRHRYYWGSPVVRPDGEGPAQIGVGKHHLVISTRRVGRRISRSLTSCDDHRNPRNRRPRVRSCS